jgi:RHS repeat-associated protein
VATIPYLSPNLPPDTRVVFDGVVYGPGDTFRFDGDPCKVLDFVVAAMSQVEAQHPETDWSMGSGFDLEDWGSLCGIKQKMDDTITSLVGTPSAPVAQPEATGPDATVPPDAETGGSLGAPAPAIALDGEHEVPPEEGGIDFRTPAEQRFDPARPRPDEAIADRLAADGLDPPAVAAQIERARRGDPPAGAPHPFRSDDEEAEDVTEGDPVDLFTGEYELRVVDLELPGRGFPLRLVRVYASGRPAFGPWGFNWDHSYNVYVRELDDGQVAVWTGELREELYVPDAAGAFDPPAGAHRALEAEVDTAGVRIGYRLAHAGGLRWRFRRPAGWGDPERIPLVEIADRHGNTHVLEYDGASRLRRVAEPDGRWLDFRYGACGLLESVSDSAARAVRYHHAAHVEHLIAVVSPPTDEYPDGLATRYDYDDGQAHPALQHNLVRTVDPAGHTVVENAYGRDPAGLDFNRVIRQDYQGEVYAYAYVELTSRLTAPEQVNEPYLRTEMRSTCGPLRVYTFNSRGNLLDERCRLVADGSYRLWATAFRYSELGQLVESRRPNGLGVRYRYDEANSDPRARGNLLEVRLIPPPTTALTVRLIARFTYEPRYQQVKTATDEANATTTYVYDYEEDPAHAGTGRLVRIEHPPATLPDGSVQIAHEHIEPDAAGRVTGRRSPEGHRTAYRFHAAGPGAGLLERLTRGADVENEAILFDYDASGLPSRVQDATGAVTEYVYSALGQLVAVLRPDVAGARGAVRYRYGRDGTLAAVEAPRGAYGDAVLPDPFIRRRVVTECLGRRERLTAGENTAEPREWRAERDAEGRPTELVDPVGRVTRRVWDERGRLLSESVSDTTATPRVVRFEYDRNGNRRRMVDAAGQETIYRYDAWDRLREVEIPALSSRSVVTYGVRDQVETVELFGPKTPGASPMLLRRLTQTFDERLRLVRLTEGVVTHQLGYDRDSRLVRVADQRGAVWQSGYDGLDRVRTQTDPLGNTTTYTYDVAGRRLVTTDTDLDSAGGAAATYVSSIHFDARGRAVRAVDALGNVTATDYEDRDLPVAITSPLGARTEYAHDAQGALVLARGFVGTPPVPVEHRWFRDTAGRTRRYRDPEGRETTYDYEPGDHWVRIRLADGREHVRVFDAAGRLRVQTAPSGCRVEYRYGPHGLPARVVHTAAPGRLPVPDIVYGYDGAGRPVRLEQTGDTLEWEYDANGRLARETRRGRSTSWAHDDVGGVSRLTYPDGRVDRYRWDVLGRLVGVELEQAAATPLTGPAIVAGGPLVTYEHAGRDRVVRRVSGNGVQTRYHHDAGRRLARIENVGPAGQLLLDVAYVLDADDRRRIVRVAPAPGAASRFTFDGLSRLVAVDEGITAPSPPARMTQAQADGYVQALAGALGTRTRGFDVNLADARRQGSTSNGTGSLLEQFVLDPVYRVDQWIRTRGGVTTTVPLGYDPDGYRTDDDRHAYTYDALGRLREVRDPSGALVAAQDYDAAGRLAARRDPGGVTVIRHLGPVVVQEETAGGSPLRQYAPGLGAVPAVSVSDGRTRWVHADARGSVLAVTDEQGVVLERYGYEPFGLAIARMADGVTPLAPAAGRLGPVFGGHPALTPDGLYDARARAYDAASGRFLQPDPRGVISSPDRYAYVAHDPVDLVDPTGEQASREDMAKGAMFAEATMAGQLAYTALDRQASGRQLGEYLSAAVVVYVMSEPGSEQELWAVQQLHRLNPVYKIAEGATRLHEIYPALEAGQGGFDQGVELVEASNEFSFGVVQTVGIAAMARMAAAPRGGTFGLQTAYASESEMVAAVRVMEAEPRIPARQPLTPPLRLGLMEVARRILTKTIPRVRSPEGTERSLVSQMSKSRWRFLNQVPDVRDALLRALARFPAARQALGENLGAAGERLPSSRGVPPPLIPMPEQTRKDPWAK